MRHASATSSDQAVQGHIEGVWLPRRAWLALERDKIRTLAQLAHIAPRIERVIPGIGGKTARTIREQLGDLTLLKAASADLEELHGHPSLTGSANRPDAPAPEAIRAPSMDSHPFTMEQALRAMIVWRAVCPHCGTSDIYVTEDHGSLDGS